MLKDLEKEIIAASQNEGVGSIYERIILKRFFESLQKKYNFKSVLEYRGTKITKGIDNLTFLRLGKRVAIVDAKISEIEKSWQFAQKPTFLLPIKAQKSDLVWNFAVVQMHPEVISEMIKHSKKYLLIFVPNILNWGTPFHLLYHLIFRTKCRHAEKGSLSLRTLWGLKHFLKKNKVRIIKTGLIDMPILPDIGFSISELKKTLGFKMNVQTKTAKANSQKLFSKFKILGWVENLLIPAVLKLPFAHHLYILGEVK